MILGTWIDSKEDQNRLMNLDKDNLVRLDKEDLVMIKTLDMDRLQSSIIDDHGQRDIEQELE